MFESLLLKRVLDGTLVGYSSGSQNVLAQVTPVNSLLPDPGGRPTKGFVGLSVGRSVRPSFPPPTSRGGLA